MAQRTGRRVFDILMNIVSLSSINVIIEWLELPEFGHKTYTYFGFIEAKWNDFNLLLLWNRTIVAECFELVQFNALKFYDVWPDGTIFPTIITLALSFNNDFRFFPVQWFVCMFRCLWISFSVTYSFISISFGRFRVLFVQLKCEIKA